ncbi:alpha/beta hydrolase family protein [Aquabacterium sp. OR-4]|uniref:alpha/beta hydrolase family protein n=1 Tax=Aquabacterium sp. OR-4 TaxID=2978127 RepID=UPI0028C73E97|nr:prolyl oligopeptidase family serine peptidase [Aquabacterium sp. OR-4]MDT7837940.1 prolyl oligopeptidase family serine peptidase [Aquabacterium sp. OR-4]
MGTKAARWLALAAWGVGLGWGLGPGVAMAAQAAAAPPPLNQFFEEPVLSQPMLSPSGRWLAMLLRGSSGTPGLTVIDTQGLTPPTLVARFADVRIDEVHWLDDDHLLFDIDVREGSRTGQLRGSGLFVVGRDGAGLKPLVRMRQKMPYISGKTGEEGLLPINAVLMTVPVGGGSEVMMGLVESLDDRSISDIRLFWFNPHTQARRRLPPPPFGAVQRWLFDPAGEPRVAISRHNHLVRIHWRAPGQDNWVQLLEHDVLTMPWWPLSVDGSGTLWVERGGRGNSAGGAAAAAGGGDHADTSELASFDFATGRPQAVSTVVAPGFDFHGEMVIDGRNGRALGAHLVTDAATTVWFDPVFQALQDEVDRHLPGRANRISCRQCGSDAQVVLIQSSSDTDPGSVLLWRGRSGEPRLLGQRLPAVSRQPLARLDLHRVRARDGLALPVWLTQPLPAADAAASGLRPAVVLVHGGPWVRGRELNWSPMPQFLASRGYVVIEPEFRGSTGYGWGHFRAGWQQWGQAMQDDLADALAWAVAEQRVDPQRVCIAGGSYGGYAALMGPVRHPGLYRCAAAWMALSDPLLLLEGSWWHDDDTSADVREHTLPTLVGDPRTDRAKLTAVSPLAQAARIEAPLLLAVGGKDKRVPTVHGTRLRDALAAAGRPPEWVQYDDEAHGFVQVSNQQDFARRLEAFLGRHLAPPAKAP